MFKVVWDVTNGIRADLSQYDVVRGRIKQEASGHVIPKADEGGEWSLVHKARQ